MLIIILTHKLNKMAIIDFTTTIEIVRSDGTKITSHCANHCGQNPTQEVIDSTIECYRKQKESMEKGTLYYERFGEKIYVKDIRINNGREYLE